MAFEPPQDARAEESRDLEGLTRSAVSGYGVLDERTSARFLGMTTSNPGDACPLMGQANCQESSLGHDLPKGSCRFGNHVSEKVPGHSTAGFRPSVPSGWVPQLL